MRVLEKHIENPVSDYAKRKGCLVRKMNGLGYRSWPDRMFLFSGRTMFIEFKKPDAVPTPLQLAFHATMLKKGHEVFVVDDVSYGKALIDWLIDPE